MIPSSINELSHQDTIYIAFTDKFLDQRITQWQEEKQIITNNLYFLMIFLVVLALAFIYLLIVIGKKPQIDQDVHLNFIDRIYNDIKIGICFLLIAFWTVSTSELYHSNILILIIGITILIAALGLLLVLSLVKHLKNKTLIKHTLIYTILNRLYKFIRDIYNSGSVGVKIALIVIGYPIIVAITFFMFPVTIGAAVWLSNKKIKEFNAIKEGVRKVKEGDIHHKIDISGNGEFAKLSADINGITDGLHKAVENEIRSERLKTELITNVSHDIRTPLTSIITYADLLKNETDREKSRGIS
jgi:signal transduction histidine kinase